VGTLLLWFEENIPLEYKKNKDIKEAMEILALADVFFGRIRRWQYYRFYVYIYNLLTVGIALSKDEKYPGMQEYKRSSKPLKIWIANNKNFKKKSIAEKLSQKTHTSRKRAFEDVSYLKPIFKLNKKQADVIADYLDLNTEEIEWLKN
jgi:replication factor C large subunit